MTKPAPRPFIVGVLCESEQDFRAACGQLVYGPDTRILKLFETESMYSVEMDMLLTTTHFWSRDHAQNLYDLARAHVRIAPPTSV